MICNSEIKFGTGVEIQVKYKHRGSIAYSDRKLNSKLYINVEHETCNWTWHGDRRPTLELNKTLEMKSKVVIGCGTETETRN